ncbi:FAD-binding oxidoreductase [Yimella sp. cx-51]|uniref:FAD-binding oxidoreductase n=1 Tax=Yimella sp. cx-51 TaxID=2770551 RepID=UPI00165E78A7|nr:FAD-binding oxidoreductase [Yimella sp. cx-51]MBC9955822.1 FAD-binding oxidoreductase [Yimella sp. cx-51]QTH37626.1 FAD-binding oxidoreductase [Yimella sp. cx-51]
MDPTLQSVERSVWWGWGDPALATTLPAHAKQMLDDRLGVRCSVTDHRPVPLEDITVPASRLSASTRDALTAAVGPAHLLIDDADRIPRAGGKSYVDLVRARTGDLPFVPDAVILPADHDEVAQVVALCVEHDIAVVPIGGGTSVVAGLTVADEARPVISLDLRRLTGLVSLNETDRTATFLAGTIAPDAEIALRATGFTLGHFPQSYQQASLGGFVATRSAGQSSSGYGRIDDMVEGVRGVTAVGDFDFGAQSPASAAGPRLLDLMVGSEGAFGVLTEVTLRVQPAPRVTRHAAVAFPDFSSATAALREMVQQLGHDAQPDVTRVSDADETEVSLGLAGRPGRLISAYLKRRGVSAPCLAILLWHDTGESVARDRRRSAAKILRRHGGISLPDKIARSWEHGRFNAPYLRDELITRGVFVETLETATHWSNIPALHSRVGAAITDALDGLGTPGIVQCHISHVYPAGASLYFTYLAAEAPDPLGQWRAVKHAASDAIVDAGGTITHHHAVGRDHKPWLKHEIGDVGVRMLRALKNELDPGNNLNPGALVPDAP